MQALRMTMVILATLSLDVAGCASASAKGADVVVAVVEPHVAGSEPGELGYSVSIGDMKLTNTLDILNGFSRPGGEALAPGSHHLAILVQEDVPIGTLGTLVSMATKAGYSVDNIGVFLFYADRRSMLAIPSYRSVKFSTDPEVVRSLLR